MDLLIGICVIVLGSSLPILFALSTCFQVCLLLCVVEIIKHFVRVSIVQAFISNPEYSGVLCLNNLLVYVVFVEQFVFNYVGKQQLFDVGAEWEGARLYFRSLR